MTHGQKPWVDYSQSHVVTLEEYLKHVQQKTMDKEAINQIRENWKKERREKQVIIVFTTTIVARTTKRELAKQHQVRFILAWSFVAIKETWDKF